MSCRLQRPPPLGLLLQYSKTPQVDPRRYLFSRDETLTDGDNAAPPATSGLVLDASGCRKPKLPFPLPTSTFLPSESGQRGGGWLSSVNAG
ncbi:hypothetical protein BHE74_00023823 [Ensete ventricosum]|uniref:Uncharacterized protein n=1 Tax=Ensete ventricosum TaxID=4639 RepID=A0A427ADM9_ENSVE|nr:hypothetical protein B296_00020600 [Ensete ventricosum]RWV91501.1 hypothetical protein GW17_00046211 [Ensete ventricosum]RWW68641.1 hypothetical protein BHE74_00023823 [Ensete ventricosum]RZS01937.1 hypothetical protein BHM03_00031892 [Ensete ventricosum]